MRSSVALALLLVLTSGCSYIERNTIGLFSGEANVVDTGATDSNSVNGSTSDADQQVATEQIPATESDVEIVWEIPKNPVDGYLVRYGDRRDSLTQELRVLNSELAKVNDPKYGSVYRYLLRNMPTDKSVFVSIAALHSAGTDGEAVSAPSAVFEVK